MGQQGSSASHTKSLRLVGTRTAGWGQRHLVWAAVAAVLLVTGMVVSTFVAGTVARSAKVVSQRDFRTGSAEIASTLQLAIEHEQDLVVSASGFVIGNPNATDRQFVAWARSVHALARYPELLGFGHSVIVPAAQLPAFAARAVRDPSGPLAADGTLQVVPAGRRPFYCLSVGSLTRGAQASQLASISAHVVPWEPHRGLSRFGSGCLSADPVREATLLSVLTPVYRDGVTPVTVAGTPPAFLGWVGMSLCHSWCWRERCKVTLTRP